MAKHTPGPWNVNHLADDTVRAADGTLVAEVYRNEYEPWNQKLIAAAPELLEALHECVKRLREVEDLDRKRNILPGCQQRANYVSVVLALEAIRKATGEE